MLQPACKQNPNLRDTLVKLITVSASGAKSEPCQTRSGPRSRLTAQSLGTSQSTPSLEHSSELHDLKEFSEHVMVKTTKRLLTSSFLLLLWNKEYCKTGFIPPPSVRNGNLKAGDRKEGGGEAEKAVCRSPPFRNQIIYWQCMAITALFH